MKKILYISQFYPPESIAGAFRAHDHAVSWQKKGHDITVFTGWPNYPIGRIFDGYNPEILGEFDDDGIKVLRSKIKATPNRSIIGRIANGLSYLFYGSFNLLFNSKKVGNSYDVVLATTGMVFAACLGLFYSKIHRVPFVVEFRDITFEQMVATGTPRNSWKVKLMKFLELYLANKADKVVVLTNGFKKKLCENGVPDSKIVVVPNGADTVETKHPTDRDKIVLGYFGTMGISQDVPRTLRMASAIEDVSKTSLEYILIGEGAARRDAEIAISSGEYSFASIMHGIPQAELEPFYADCDFTVVSLQNSSEFGATLPSKMFQSFARGVPVIYLGPEGEAADLIRDKGVGLVLSGTDEDNKESLRKFFGNDDWKSQICEMRCSAQTLMEQEYSREILAERMLNVLIETAMNEGRNLRD